MGATEDTECLCKWHKASSRVLALRWVWVEGFSLVAFLLDSRLLVLLSISRDERGFTLVCARQAARAPEPSRARGSRAGSELRLSGKGTLGKCK